MLYDLFDGNFRNSTPDIDFCPVSNKNVKEKKMKQAINKLCITVQFLDFWHRLIMKNNICGNT